MRIPLVVAVVIALLAISSPARADEVYPITFPVDGPNHFSDTYDAPRSGGRTHQATDIMADKMTPVLAAADGTVGWMSSTCCSMELVHDDGYQSWYIHLNNDTPGTDDGQAWGFAEGIEPGVHVTAGQLLGWVGDSGNAEETAPHLHFQLHYPSGERFNPYESLLAALENEQSASNNDEIFFYSEVGAYAYYDIGPDADLGEPLRSGDEYSKNWDTITAVDLEGDGKDEMFFYRTTGSYRYYDTSPTGGLHPIRVGDTGYSKNWDSITAVDLDGDGKDEMFFYRTTGSYRYYEMTPTGGLIPIGSGTDYALDWDSVTAVNLD